LKKDALLKFKLANSVLSIKPSNISFNIQMQMDFSGRTASENIENIEPL
jgi:hypothetical protein